MEKIIVDISWDENYGASSDDVLGCVATHDTLEGIKKEYASLLQFHREGLENDQVPKKLKDNYELVFKLDVHALLNHYKGVVTFAALSEVTGINKKQLGHYAQGYRKAHPQHRDKIVKGIQELGKHLISVV